MEDAGLGWAGPPIRGADFTLSQANVRVSAQLRCKIACDGKGQPRSHLLLAKYLERYAMVNASSVRIALPPSFGCEQVLWVFSV